MKKHKNLIFYVTTISIFSILIYVFQYLGKEFLEGSRSVENSLVVGNSSPWAEFWSSLLENISHPISILLIQIVIILFAVRTFGWICKKIGQPTVVGEIIAGIILGPSLFGYYYPEFSTAIFPLSSLSNISLLSQIGLVLFMFIVGMELDFKTIKNRANDAVIISHASIIFPFALGVALSFFIYEHFTHANVDFLSFSLFMGIAMSITAFPVLARIVHERGINKTPLGSIVITCAAIDDITAWCLLAAVIAIVKAGSFLSALYVFGAAIAYVLIMFMVVRPFLKRIADLQTSKNIITKSIIGIFFLVLFLSAYTTEIIGIHALFGAFLTGVIMPSNINFRKLFVEKIEDVALVLLLPLFFVYTGLRTQIGLLNDPYLWKICAIIIAVAVTGKFVGSALAARFIGQNWKNSLTIGTLMNTRGLMELIVLNIGYDLGVLTPEVFAMMVIMALVTTLMTSPVLDLIDRVFKNKTTEKENRKTAKILVSFDNPEIGKKLLLIANAFVKKEQSHNEVTMVHLSPGDNFYQYNIEDEEYDTFSPVLAEAKRLEQPIIPFFEVASESYAKVVKMANKGDYDVLLIGEIGSIYGGNILGNIIGFSNKIMKIPNLILAKLLNNKRLSVINSRLDNRIQSVIANCDLPVGIFVDRGLKEIKHVFVPILDEEDLIVAQYMERLARNTPVRITLWDAIGLSDKSIDFIKAVRSIKNNNPFLFLVWNKDLEIESNMLQQQDLMLVSLSSWEKLHESDYDWVKNIPSSLVLADNN